MTIATFAEQTGMGGIPGIKMPVITNRFILGGFSRLSDKNNNALRHQLIRVKEELVVSGKTLGRLTMEFEDAEDGTTLAAINSLTMIRGFDINIACASHVDITPCPFRVYKSCRLDSVQYKLDYSNTETARYIVVLKFDQVYMESATFETSDK